MLWQSTPLLFHHGTRFCPRVAVDLGISPHFKEGTVVANKDSAHSTVFTTRLERTGAKLKDEGNY
jgi:hypothetical protein